MPRIAVTLGDPRGIGPEIVRRALAQPLAAEVTLVGAEDQLEGIPAQERVVVGRWDGGAGEGSGRGRHARTVKAGRIAGHSVEAAAQLALEGEVDAVVTGPVHKHALHLGGFPYPGHT